MSDPLDQFRPLEGQASVYRRADQRPDWSRIHLHEDRVSQGTDLNDGFELERRGRQSIGDMVARDGDRVEGAAAVPDPANQSITLDAGAIYVDGQVHPVAAATLNSVPMTGELSIGVRRSSTIIDHVSDDALLGLHPGSESEGEAGAVVEVVTIHWGFQGDGSAGELVPVYRMVDGVILDQTAPADLSVAQQSLERFTDETLGGYLARGFELFALGKVADAQVFSLREGSAYVRGRNIARNQSTRIEIVEDPDTGTSDAEPHTFDDGGTGTATLELRRTPIQSVNSVIVTKETTETLSRGVGTGGSETLGNDSVQSIISVVSGPTTYTEGADYILDGDAVSWAPGGQEPAQGASYDVTYRYFDTTPVDAVDDTSVTVSGGVTGELALVQYAYKLPRIDRVCLDIDGLPVYLKGVSSAVNPQPPTVPDTLVKIATVRNDWAGTPLIDVDGVRNITFAEQWRYNKTVEDLQDLMGLERGARDLDSREPAAKQGIFVDPFTSDRYRDAGAQQTAAVFGGGAELPIEAVIEELDLGDPQFLPFTEQVVVDQPLASGCMKINPYQVFVPPPARMTITPSVDFWEETNTVWASDVTQRFGRGNRSAVSNVFTEPVSSVQTEATFLRQISIGFEIEGFGAGEILEALEFDMVDVTPPGLVADGQGVVTGSFIIPENMTTGTKAVAAHGAGGSFAAAEFVGEGVINTVTMRRVTTIRRWPDPQPPRPLVLWEPRDQGSGARADPLAQTFMLTVDRMLTGIDVQFCAIGDPNNPAYVELVTVENGIPTTNVVAQAEIDVGQVIIGQWTPARFAIPIFVPRNTEYAFVFKTDDADHSLRIATRGEFMTDIQEFVGAQPYTVGVLLSSSNATTWTPHQNSDLTMRIQAAVFDPTTRVVELGTISGVSDVSDILINAAVDLPTVIARCLFEVEFDDTSVETVEPGQALQLDAYYAGDLKLRAVLTGSATISPILFPRLLVALGTLQATGSYVSRAFAFGEDIKLTARMKTFLPAGSTLTVEQDAADNVWTELTADDVETILQGWQDRAFVREPITATTGRLRLTLTGNPAARPVLADLRSATLVGA